MAEDRPEGAPIRSCEFVTVGGYVPETLKEKVSRREDAALIYTERYRVCGYRSIGSTAMGLSYRSIGQEDEFSAEPILRNSGTPFAAKDPRFIESLRSYRNPLVPGLDFGKSNLENIIRNVIIKS